MTIARTLGAAAVAAVLSVLSAGQAPAQSLLSATGLGTPLEPVDARARGLGGLPLGLPEPQMSLVNPAAAVGLPAAGLTVTFQSTRSPARAPGRPRTTPPRAFPWSSSPFPSGSGW